MKRKKNWIIGGTFAFLLVLGIALGVIMNEGKSSQLTEEQAKNLVMEKYAGTVVGTTLVDNQYYRMKLNGSKGTYDIDLEANTGKILSIKQTKAIHQPVGKETNKPPSHTDSSSKITVQDAKKIALKQVNGVVDEAELKGKGSTQVYEVEIKTKNKEAKVYINVYTGKVGAVVWENDD